MARTPKTAKGMLVNLNAGLMLPFMLNPRPISQRKSVTWDIEEIPGLPAPIHYYQSGGQKVITFDLFFDASESGVSTGHFSFVNAIGTTGIQNILESFLYPQALELKDIDLKRLVNQNKFTAPPLVYLVMGFRFWKGYLMSAPMEETKWNSNLFPTQFTTSIEFSVVEDGVINEINTVTRNTTALIQSALNAIQLVEDRSQDGLDFADFNFVISLLS